MKTKKKPAARRKVAAKEAVHTVATHYYGDYEGTLTIKTNSAKYALNAVLRAYEHLYRTRYFGAVLAEVYDLLNGNVYAILRLDVTGRIDVIHQDDSIDRDAMDEAYRQSFKNVG